MKDNIILRDVHLHIICLMIVNRSVDSDMIFTAQCRSSLNVQHHVLVHRATMFTSDWGTVYHDNYALMIGGF